MHDAAVEESGEALVHAASRDAEVEKRPKREKRRERYRQRQLRCVADVERSRLFQHFITCVVLANCFFLAWQANSPDEPYWSEVDNCFLVIYCGEIALRLWVHRCHFFYNQDWAWNQLDFLVVGIWLAHTIYVHIPSHQPQDQLSLVVRLLRLTRVVRCFRIVHYFKSLRRLWLGLVDSMFSVFWVAMTFLILVFVAAIFVTIVVGRNADKFGEHEDDIRRWFGSMPASMNTLFIYLTFDDWAHSARIVVTHYKWFFYFWVWFLSCGGFLLLSLLTGLMAEKMNAARLTQLEERESKNQAELETLIAQFREHFEDDVLDPEDFEEFVSKPEVAEVLKRCGCSLARKTEDQAARLFKALDRDKNGEVTWEEFHNAMIFMAKHPSKNDALRELMWVEGKVKNLDRWTEQWELLTDPAILEWDRQLDDVHLRASVLRRRLMCLDSDLHDFFKTVKAS